MKTKTQQAHTELPWRVEWLDEGHGWIMDEAGNYLFEVVTEDEEGRCATPWAAQAANAQFVVLACNLHGPLLDALEEMHEEVMQEHYLDHHDGFSDYDLEPGGDCPKCKRLAAISKLMTAAKGGAE